MDKTRPTPPLLTPVRMDASATDEKLPEFLTVRYDELIERDRADWETNVKTPRWWYNHMQRHSQEVDGWRRRERMEHPSYQPFLRSLCLLPLLATVWLGAYLYFLKVKPDYLPVPSASAACGMALLIATVIAAMMVESPGWALKHVGVPPLSLYLTFQEFRAWRAWRAHGERWQNADWSQIDAVDRVAARFKVGPVNDCDTRLYDMRTRERQLREEAKGAEARVRDFTVERDRLGSAQEIHAEQLSRSITFTQERADALAAKADRLKALGDETGVRIASLRTALDAYIALEHSRLRLRETKSLDEGGTEDLRQLALVREEYRRVQNLLAQVEPIIQGTPTQTACAADQDELTTRIKEAAARAEARR